MLDRCVKPNGAEITAYLKTMGQCIQCPFKGENSIINETFTVSNPNFKWIKTSFLTQPQLKQIIIFIQGGEQQNKSGKKKLKQKMPLKSSLPPTGNYKNTLCI